MDSTEYQNKLAETLEAYCLWLEKSEFPKLKEACRTLHNSFAALYKMFLQKRLIHEDPYKQDVKIAEIKVPDPIGADGNKLEQLTVNLSAYDNQLDFLANFAQLDTDFLTLDTIKRISALVKYIEWTKFTLDTPSTTTKALVDLTVTIKTSGDPMGSRIVTDSAGAMDKASVTVMGCLKVMAGFNREFYKLELRQNITGSLKPGEMTVEQIRKKFPSAMPKKPFYPDLVDEVLKEDAAPGGEKLREEILKKFAVPDNKPKAEQTIESFKPTLLEGFVIISSAAVSMAEMAPKLDENNSVLQNRKQSFLAQIKAAIRQMMHKEPDPVIYDVEYIDTAKGAPVKEKVNFNVFRADVEKKIRTYGSLSTRGVPAARLASMEEKQLLPLLERAVRDAQAVHKTLTGLDEYFKAAAPKEVRDKIKGIKPELATMKNAIIKANQRRHEYSAQLEESEQFKKLGVQAQAQDNAG
jgi:hypothetical protein